MLLKEEQMIERIMDTDTMGYAYVYPGEAGNREEYMVALTAENLANLIGGKGTDARQIIVTDVMDRLVVNTRLGILDTCPDQRLCGEIIRHLTPIQMGGEGSQGDPGSKPGCSRRILSGRRTGGHYGRMPDAVGGSGAKKRESEGKDMGWILGLVATAAVFVAGAAGLACVAVCRISQCRLD